MASCCKLLLEEVPSIWKPLQWQHNAQHLSVVCQMHNGRDALRCRSPHGTEQSLELCE